MSQGDGRCVFLHGDGAGLALMRSAAAAIAPETAVVFLVWLDDESLGAEFQAGGRPVRFVHLLRGDQLFRHTRLIRELFGAGEFEPLEHDQLLASLLYTETRFYYPIRRFLEESGAAGVDVSAGCAKRPLAAVVRAAADAVGLAWREHPTDEALVAALRARPGGETQ